MSYGKVIAYGVVFVALAWLESVAGEKKRNWEDKYQEYQDDLDALNKIIEDKIQSANENIIFEEYIQLHFQSFSVADEKKRLLDDARDSIAAIYKTLNTLKENREDINKKLSIEKDKIKTNNFKKELRSISETRKVLFDEVNLFQEQKKSLEKTLKKFNINTHDLKIVIRDYGGSRGRKWYEKLEDRKAQRNNQYKNTNSQQQTSCFLSTACTRYKGLPDDCMELETLRYFRDTYVIALDNGKELIDEYYKNAPKILSEISRSNTNENKVLTNIYHEITEIVNYIKIEENQKAFENYEKMYKELKRIYF